MIHIVDMQFKKIRGWARGIALLLALILLLCLGACSPADPDGANKPDLLLPNLVETQGADSTALTPVHTVNPPDHSPALLPEALSEAPDLTHAPHYTLNLIIADDLQSFDGSSHLLYTNNEDTALDHLYFRLLPNAGGAYGDGSLTVSQVLVDGEIVEYELSSDDSVMKVPFGTPLEPGDRVEIAVDFSGQVPENFGFDQNSAGYGIYNYSDGVLSLASWYPILAVYDEDGWNLDPVSSIGDSVYSDIANYTVEVTVPRDVILAATGVEVDRQEDDGGTRFSYVSGPVRDFYLIMSEDFTLQSMAVDGTKVTSYTLPGNKAAGKLALSIASESLGIFNEQFGPYPYTELDVVDAPMRYASGVEFPGIILIRDSLYEDSDNPIFTVVLAHEVAHQWWYNVVGNDVFDDPWLDEALTSYSSSLYYEFSQGKSAPQGLIDYWYDHYQGTVDRGYNERVTDSLAYFEGLPDPKVYGGIVYSKGALFFKALRDEIGDEAFFQALRNYYNLYGFTIAEPGDLLNAFEVASGRSLDELYQEWLYSP